jgi:hypothetical protein
MGYHLILTKSIRRVVNIFFCQRVDIEESSNVRLMVAPLERVPIQPKIVNVLLPLKLPTVKNTILSLIGVKVSPNG